MRNAKTDQQHVQTPEQGVFGEVKGGGKISFSAVQFCVCTCECVCVCNVLVPKLLDVGHCLPLVPYLDLPGSVSLNIYLPVSKYLNSGLGLIVDGHPVR